MRYQLVVSSPVGIRSMQPAGLDSLKVTHQKPTGYCMNYERRFSGALVFTGDDYRYFARLEASTLRTAKIRAEIYEDCGGAWQLKDKVFFTLNRGKWDADRCTVSFEALHDTFLTVVQEGFGRQFNLFGLATTQARYGATGLFEYYNVTTLQIGSYLIKNGISVQDTIRGMLDQMGFIGTLVSGFFQWNEDEGSPDNYLGFSDYRTLRLFQVSDVVRRNISGLSPATVMLATFGEIIEDLCKLANLRWMVDGAGSFRIEHVSYFAAQNGPDARALPFNRARNKWSYQEAIPRYETLTIPRSEGNRFKGYNIEYTNPAASPDGSVEVVETKVTQLATDLASLLRKDPNAEQDFAGILLVSVNSASQVLPVYATLAPDPNLPWAAETLMERFWRWDRYFAAGTLNGVATAFNSTKPIKLQENIVVRACCGEAPFDPGQRIRTEIGWGMVNAAEHSYSDGTVKCSLLHEFFLDPLAAPTAAPDAYITYVDTAIDFTDQSTAGTFQWENLLNNDTGNGLQLIEAVQTTMAGGTVEIGDAIPGGFLYTPPPGYRGRDQFEYYLYDAHGYLDIGTARIVVRPLDLACRLTQGLQRTDTVGPVRYFIAGLLVSFFEDIGTVDGIPFDMADLGAIIDWKIVTTSGGSSSTAFYEETVAGGTVWQLSAAGEVESSVQQLAGSTWTTVTTKSASLDFVTVPGGITILP